MVAGVDFWTPGEGEQNNNLQEWQTRELQPQVEASTVETVWQITQVLETPKIDALSILRQASYFPIVDPKTLEWDESAWQLIASILEWSEDAKAAVDQAVTKYVESMNSSNSTALYRAFSKAINDIMSWVKDWLDKKVQNLMAGWDEMWADKLILWEELSAKLADLYAYLDNIGKTDADSLEKIDVEKGRKLWNWFRKVFGWNTLKNVKANVRAATESDETRFAKLDQAKEKIEAIITRIQQYPKEVVEDINTYKTTSMLLEWLKKHLQTEVKKQITTNDTIDLDSKQTLNQDIDRMVVEVDNLIALLNNSINIYVNLMKESTLLWREIDLNYLRANYTTLLAVYQNASTDVMKKWVWVAERLLEIERASNVSMMGSAIEVTSSITQLWANRAASIEFLNKQITQFTQSISSSQAERTQNNAKVRQEVALLGQNVKALWHVVIESK